MWCSPHTDNKTVKLLLRRSSLLSAKQVHGKDNMNAHTYGTSRALNNKFAMFPLGIIPITRTLKFPRRPAGYLGKTTQRSRANWRKQRRNKFVYASYLQWGKNKRNQKRNRKPNENKRCKWYFSCLQHKQTITNRYNILQVFCLFSTTIATLPFVSSPCNRCPF